MTCIHSSAIIEEGALLGSNVKIGPYCVIGKGVSLLDNVELKSHVVIDGYTEVGYNTVIYPFASIGHAPQDLKYKGEKSKIIIGNNNVIREYVTINPGTIGGELITRIGNNCLLMLGTHIAHDCKVGNFVIFANNATLGGHVTIGDYATIGGLAAIHQYVRIGSYAIIGGVSAVVRDVIPFGMAVGDRAYLEGINLVGMQRHGFTNEEINTTKEVIEILFLNKNLPWTKKIQLLHEKFNNDKSIQQILSFINEESIRAYCGYKI